MSIPKSDDISNFLVAHVKQREITNLTKAFVAACDELMKGRWITVKGDDDQTGVHVYIEDGKVTKGPKGMVGDRPARDWGGGKNSVAQQTDEPAQRRPLANQNLEKRSAPMSHYGTPKASFPGARPGEDLHAQIQRENHPVSHYGTPKADYGGGDIHSMSIGRPVVAGGPGGGGAADIARSFMQSGEQMADLRGGKWEVVAFDPNGEHVTVNKVGDSPDNAEVISSDMFTRWANAHNHAKSAVVPDLPQRDPGVGQPAQDKAQMASGATQEKPGATTPPPSTGAPSQPTREQEILQGGPGPRGQEKMTPVEPKVDIEPSGAMAQKVRDLGDPAFTPSDPVSKPGPSHRTRVRGGEVIPAGTPNAADVKKPGQPRHDIHERGALQQAQELENELGAEHPKAKVARRKADSYRANRETAREKSQMQAEGPVGFHGQSAIMPGETKPNSMAASYPTTKASRGNQPITTHPFSKPVPPDPQPHERMQAQREFGVPDQPPGGEGRPQSQREAYQYAKKFEGTVAMALNAIKADPKRTAQVLMHLRDIQPTTGTEWGKPETGDFAHVLHAAMFEGKNAAEVLQAWLEARRVNLDASIEQNVPSGPVKRKTLLSTPRVPLSKSMLVEEMEKAAAGQPSWMRKEDPEHWDKAKDAAAEQGHDPETTGEYGYAVAIFDKMAHHQPKTGPNAKRHWAPTGEATESGAPAMTRKRGAPGTRAAYRDDSQTAMTAMQKAFIEALENLKE